MRIKQLTEKYNKLPLALRAGIWFTICFIFQRGIQFIGMPIFTRMMSQTEYGIYASFNSWARVLVIISSLNIYSSIINKAMIKYGDNREQYISSIQSLTTLSSAVLAGIILFCSSRISEILNINKACLMMMSIYILTFPSIQYWSQRQRFSFNYKSIILITIIDSVLNFGLGILFVYISDSNKGNALVGATVLVQLMISLVLYVYLMLKGKCVFRKEYWLWSLGLAIPLLPHYLSEILLGHADRIMINSMCGSDKAAIYNIAYQISMLMTIVRTGLNGAFLPWEYQMIKGEEYEKIKSTTNMYAFVMAFMTIMCMMFGPEVLLLAAPASYHEAIYVIPPIMAGCYYIFVYVLYSNVEMYYEKKQYVAIASIVAALLNVVLNYTFIKLFGYLIAGYTTAISYAVMVIMHYCFFKKIEKGHKEIKKIYNKKYIWGTMIVVSVFSLLSIFLYTTNYIRYPFILVLFVIAIIYRKNIVELVRTIRER